MIIREYDIDETLKAQIICQNESYYFNICNLVENSDIEKFIIDLNRFIEGYSLRSLESFDEKIRINWNFVNSGVFYEYTYNKGICLYFSIDFESRYTKNKKFYENCKNNIGDFLINLEKYETKSHYIFMPNSLSKPIKMSDFKKTLVKKISEKELENHGHSEIENYYESKNRKDKIDFILNKKNLL